MGSWGGQSSMRLKGQAFRWGSLRVPHVLHAPDFVCSCQVKADARCIRSEQFACSYSLRFPRVERVRLDLGVGEWYQQW